MIKIKYISFEEALEIHRLTIEKSGGGDFGELDTGKLDSILTHIQNDDYYPTFLEKIVHLFFVRANFIALQMAIKELLLHYQQCFC